MDNQEIIQNEEINEIVSDEEVLTVDEFEGVPFAKQYMGKEIISESTRIVNDREYIHIRLIDGTTHDLTSEQYALEVTEN